MTKNLHEIAVNEVRDPADIQVGEGKSEEGDPRVCIAIRGEPIHFELEPGFDQLGWSSLTPESAAHLHRQLEGVKHLWQKT